MKNGYITLITILIITAVVLMLTATVSLLAIGQAQSGLALVKGEDALGFVEGCMEDALLKIKNSPTYAGGTITRPEGTCQISIVKTGNIWTTTATTTATSYSRTIQTVSTRIGTLSLTSWKEL